MSQDGLLSKFTLLSLLPLDRRVGRKHLAVYGFILDWHHRKYGDALASVRHVVGELKNRDPFGKGLYMGDVHAALVDLVAWGYLTQEKGSGRRASRYVPVWTVFDSVRESPNTTEDNPSVRENPNADVREFPNATGHSVRAAPNEDPPTGTRLQDRGTEGDKDCSSPSAPLEVGLSATSARTVQDRFEELWRTYGVRRQKSDARSAFLKIDPDPMTFETMLAAAKNWREAWKAQENPGAPRKLLHTWLREEDWDCDPPSAFVKRAKKSANDNAPIPTPDGSAYYSVWPGRHVGQHAGCVIGFEHFSDRKGEKSLEIVVQFSGGPSRGEVASLKFVTESSDAKALVHGHSKYAQLAQVMGRDEMDEPSELLGIPFDMEIDQFGNADFSPAGTLISA